MDKNRSSAIHHSTPTIFISWVLRCAVQCGKKVFKDVLYLFAGDKSAVTNPDDYDLAEFPLYSKATTYKVILEPGDQIFIPCQYSMIVPNVVNNISILMLRFSI